MLGLLKHFLKLILVPALYSAWMVTIILTVVKEARWGFYLLVFLIPQPNIWYKFFDYPFGSNTIDLLFVALVLGIMFQKKGFKMTSATPFIFALLIFSYFSLWEASFNFDLPVPLTTSNIYLLEWKNYAQMVLLYFVALNVMKEEDNKKKVILLMSFVVLFIAFRSYRNFDGGDVFNYDKRVGGPFERVGLGANHFGAFIADYSAVFLGLFLFDKNKWRRLLFLATVLLGLHPLFFAYSRGAYLAAFAVVVIFGVLKKRSLLIGVFVVLVAWQAILPASVVDRIQRTETPEGELEHSAGGRILLWQLAIDLFKENPITGIGFAGYQISAGGQTLADGEVLPENQDVHNYYMRVLCEQGLIGFSILVLVLLMALRSGWKLYKSAETPFQKGLGFGFFGCAISMIITNMFGDRWSYFVLGSFFWIFWGLVDRTTINIAEKKASDRLRQESEDEAYLNTERPEPALSNNFSR